MSNVICPEQGVLTNERLGHLLTQYRESPKLIHLIKTYLLSAEKIALQICDLPSHFNIDTAIGDQLTLLGKRLGWPRCHCVCDVQPVFGFDCENYVSEHPVSGFCDEAVTWNDCGVFGQGDICINDDEIYRKFLKVRRYQMLGHFDIKSLTDCLNILFGETASVIDSGFGRVVISPGRNLSDFEIALLQLYPRILPIALGIEVRFHFDTPDVFGFGDGWGGFCEPWEDSINLETDESELLITDSEQMITTGVMTKDAPWMCEIDVKPYSC